MTYLFGSYTYTCNFRIPSMVNFHGFLHEAPVIETLHFKLVVVEISECGSELLINAVCVSCLWRLVRVKTVCETLCQ